MATREESLIGLDRAIAHQEEKVMRLGEFLVPNLTSEDLLQPNDFPELENDPRFRYEEGVLQGLKTARVHLLRKL